MIRFVGFAGVLALGVLLGCSGEREREASASAGDVRAGDYVEVESFLRDDRFDAWFDVVRRLAREFDEVCGDTFCEGEYTNLAHLSFRCSVSRRTGALGTCVWTFAGSVEDATASTGNVRAKVASFKCKMPIAPGTSAADFTAALGGAKRAIEAKLPRSERSLFDGLVDCL